MKLDSTKYVSLIYSKTIPIGLQAYTFRSELTDCFCYATKQTYYIGEPDPETPQQLRWGFSINCEQLKAVKYYRKVLHLKIW